MTKNLSFIFVIIFLLFSSNSYATLSKNNASNIAINTTYNMIKYFGEKNYYILTDCKRKSQFSFNCNIRAYAKRASFQYRLIITKKNNVQTLNASNMQSNYNLYAEYKRVKRTKNLIKAKEIYNQQMFNADAHAGAISTGLNIIKYFGKENPYILKNCHRLSKVSFKCNVRAYTSELGVRFEMTITQLSDGIGLVRAKNLYPIYNRYKLYILKDRKKDLIDRNKDVAVE